MDKDMTILGNVHASLIFGRRVRVIAGHFCDLVPRSATVLDVGCGDGTIDKLILESRPDLSIVGIDVLIRPVTHIAVEPFDGVTIPYADRSFDVVMFVDVLHHTDNPMALLREATRVARHGVVLKDHTKDGILAEKTLRFMDWFGNNPHGVACPYNYWSYAQWQGSFRALGLIVKKWIPNVGLYPWPASILFDRELHFIAQLAPEGGTPSSHS